MDPTLELTTGWGLWQPALLWDYYDCHITAVLVLLGLPMNNSKLLSLLASSFQPTVPVTPPAQAPAVTWTALLPCPPTSWVLQWWSRLMQSNSMSCATIVFRLTRHFPSSPVVILSLDPWTGRRVSWKVSARLFCPDTVSLVFAFRAISLSIAWVWQTPAGFRRAESFLMIHRLSTASTSQWFTAAVLAWF